MGKIHLPVPEQRETNWNSNGHRKRDRAPAKQNKSDLHPHHIKHDRWKRGSNQFKIHCLYHMKRSTTRRRGRCHHYPYYRSLILSLTSYYTLNTHRGKIIIKSSIIAHLLYYRSHNKVILSSNITHYLISQ